MSNCYIIDTNVPAIASRSASQLDDLELECAEACLLYLRKMMTSSDIQIVLDYDYLVVKEYRRILSKISYSNGFNEEFLKWVFMKMSADDYQFVKIHKEGTSFLEYPNHDDLSSFDREDRKFIALANAHQDKPPIIEGTDCKWWGIVNALKSFGITVVFPCEKYIMQKYQKKIG